MIPTAWRQGGSLPGALSRAHATWLTRSARRLKELVRIHFSYRIRQTATGYTGHPRSPSTALFPVAVSVAASPQASAHARS